MPPRAPKPRSLPPDEGPRARSLVDRARPGSRLHPDAPYRRALVIANPIAGRGRGESVGRETLEGLSRLGVPAELHLTRGPGDGRARLASIAPDTDLVVCVGGDGTLGEVFSGLPSPDLLVGMVPVGTANALGLDLGLPRDVDRALEVFVRGRTAKIDVARVNGRLSFLVCGVGIDGVVARKVDRLRRGPITKWTWVRAFLQSAPSYRAPRLSIEVDGELLPGEYGLVLISNMVHYGGVFRLSADCRRDDGLYEVYLFREGRLTRMIPYLLRLATGRLPGGSCELLRARRVVVRSREPVPYQIDGDVGGETPVEIEVSSQPYNLLVP